MASWNDRVVAKLNELVRRKEDDRALVRTICQYIDAPSTTRGATSTRHDKVVTVSDHGVQIFSFTVEDGQILVTPILNKGETKHFTGLEDAYDRMAELMARAVGVKTLASHT